MCQLQIKEEVEDQVQETLPGVIRISLIDWKLLTNIDFIRYLYKVIEITTHPDPFQYRDKWAVRTDVVGYAYSTGIYRSTVRCQEMYYFGVEGFGSIVCKNCLFGARFALFSLHEDSYVCKLHAHSLFSAKCLYCNRLITSTPVSRCLEYKNEIGIFMISALYRCLRVYKKLVVDSDGKLKVLEEIDGPLIKNEP